MTLNRSTEKIQYWRSLLDEQPRTGMTVKAFCEWRGVSVPSFYSWRKKIQQEDAATSGERAVDHAGLVPVTVIDPLKAQATDGAGRDDQCIEIVTPDGFALRVRRDVPPGKIAELLQAIESCRRGVAAC